MVRSIASIVTGVVVWGILWVSMNGVMASVFPESIRPNSPINDVSILTFFIAFSVALSVLAGYLAAWIAGRKEMAHALILGIIQLGIGVMVTIQYYDLLPGWYHVIFLLLVIPGHWFGGLFRTRQKERV